MIGAFVPMRGKKEDRWLGWVIEANGCHKWTGTKNSSGYGLVYRDGRSRLVHRVRYRAEVGPIPPGLELDHLCDNGPGGCCNPAHCEAVTHRENLRRTPMIAAKAAQTHCVNGHPYNDENTYTKPNGCRDCRACKRERQNRYDRAKREARNAG